MAVATAAAVGIAPVAARAICTDGSSFPAGGYVVGQAPIVTAANWSPNVFTGTAGSIWIPDNSTFEHNDPNQPLTNGGHNWVFDQGSTLCKETYVGPAGGQPTGWTIPPNTPTDCVVLPIIKNGVVQNLGDIPYQGDVITPTCDPTKLSTPGAPNPANTRLNQLGCSISHGVATNAHNATSFLFVAGIHGGLFSIPLDNAPSNVVGGNSGKVPGGQNYYSSIPEGSLLSSAAVSPDGQFAIVTSIRRALSTKVWACLNPLGDPGDPSQPINPGFFVPSANTVKCMQVGDSALAANLTTAFGPDNQPYMGGQRIVNSFDGDPGGISPSAWPQCIFSGNGAGSLVSAFANPTLFSNGCGNAQPNFGFSAALVTQPNSIISHVAKNGDMYMYTGPLGGTVLQFYLTVDPFSGLTKYQFRTYLTGVSLTTGLGIEEGQGALMVYTDPTAVGLAGQEVVTKLPLCEDLGPSSAPPPPARAVFSNFNGDGTSDILWRNTTTNQVYEYLMNGTSILSAAPVATVTPDWAIAGRGDFDGDGKADILWYNTTSGLIYEYLMNGAAITSALPVTTVTTDWKVAGVGDFDGDGKADILWRNAVTNQIYLYTMNGSAITASGPVATVTADWQVAGVGDFNGDGKADILWFNTVTRQVYLYTMSGTAITAAAPVATVGAGWQIAGVGDFDGDGKSDILWNNTATGEVYVYLMNGAAVTAANPVATVTLDWQIAEVGDFTGDGKADILWRNTTSGLVYLYTMNSAAITAAAPVATVTLDWQIVK